MEPEIIELKLKDKMYPIALSFLPNPPKQLFVIGNPKILNEKSIAIVGTRKPTDYGIEVAKYFAKNLSQHFVVVSGLAYGIDTVALDAAVNAKGKPVIGVIGSGLNRTSFYPQINWFLAMKIIREGGAIISEYPPGTPPLKHHFPARNRIIAGLSEGTLVVEAGIKSGALITANLALDNNKEVFAVAGSIFNSLAEGVNQIIKEGAYLVTTPYDVIDAID